MDEQILHNVNQKLDRMIEQGRDLIDEEALKQQIENGSSQLRDQIRRYPVASVVAGLAAGFLFARIFRKG